MNLHPDIHICMGQSVPSWDVYRTFLAVIRDGSLTTAARTIGVTQPTAGRHIQAMEAAIGVRLFNRLPGGLVPTDAAHRLVPYVEAMSAAAIALDRASSGNAREESGIVRLTAAELIGHEALPDILRPFCVMYPAIVVEVKLSNRNEDILRGNADIAIRMARPAQKALIARRIGAVKLGLFADRRYINVFGIPRTLEDIKGHRLIGFDDDQHILRPADEGTPPPKRTQFGFRCDSAPMQAAAIRAGLGIGCLHLNSARNSSSLVRVLEKNFTFTREMWLVMHEDAKATRRIRLLFDHLVDGLTTYVRQNS